MHTNFGWLDGGIILAYLVTLASIGFYFSKRQANLEVFFLAGRGMGWLPVGLSLMACLNSGIDYIMGPSSTMRFGLILLTGTASWFLLWPWVYRVMLPFYRRLDIYTAYEYLERRFDTRVRTLAASIFLLWRIGWIATAMYVPCFAICAASGGRIPLTPLILLLGSIVVLYTVLGGMKAVIWTDVIQFFVMFGGLAATVWIVVASVPGGVPKIWAVAQEAGRTSFATPIPGAAHASFFQKIGLFFHQDITVIGLFVAAMVGRLAVYTGDQVMVQRFQTTKSLKDSKQAFIINAVGDVAWSFGLALVGLALLAYFKVHVLPADIKNDEIFPHFMAENFPTGAIGLVIAAIFAASLGAIGSALNSCTSVVIIDFYNHLFRKKSSASVSAEEDREQVRISRIATLLIGVVAIAISSNVGRLGDLIEIANRVIQLFTGPLFAIYILGMFTRRARSGGVLIGGLLGAGVSAYVAFLSGLGFVWPSVFGFAVALVVGYACSLIQGPAPESQVQLTFSKVMQLPERGPVAEEVGV